MPYYRKSKRTKKYRKRTNKRRISPSSANGPLSNKIKAKLIYHETMDLNPGVGGVPTSHVFSANGVYDPNITGVGHQPRGFDQMINLYDHCTVIASKINITCSNDDTIIPQMLALSLRDSSTSPATYDDIMEYRYIKTKVLGNSTANSTGTMSMACNPNKYLGKSNPLNNSDVRNDAGNNPVEQAYFHLTGFPINGFSDTAAIRCQVRIEYTCVFTEPKQPTAS